ncbi:response regulator [Hoeflea sp. AS60]|uniref:response regulator transcription factor n=1 Tax=Hoeflea sp. AS60 TaxID=3135780 RepID=UPI003173EC81
MMPIIDTTVYIIDDDFSVLDSLTILLETEGYHVMSFRSARAFLEAAKPEAGCLVLDLKMPEMTGLELQERLKAETTVLPIVIITAYGEVRSAVEAMKLGAFDFIEKPFDDKLLLDTVANALQHGRVQREKRMARQLAEERLTSLSAREMEVLDMVASGCSSKLIGDKLGISRRTVEIHRANIVRKAGTRTLAELLMLAREAGLGLDVK